MFIIPVFYMKEEANRLKQTRIIEEVTFFVDGVRNTGILSREDYSRLENVLYHLGGGYRIDMTHYSHMPDESGESVLYNEVGNYNEQILECFQSEQEYYLKKFDYLKIVIKDNKNQVIAWYGGSVKYEAY
jgi:hypothetical protein